MRLEIQKWIDEHGISSVEKFGIEYSVHKSFPNLYQLTYNQISSQDFKFETVVRQSRGLI